MFCKQNNKFRQIPICVGNRRLIFFNGKLNSHQLDNF